MKTGMPVALRNEGGDRAVRLYIRGKEKETQNIPFWTVKILLVVFV